MHRLVAEVSIAAPLHLVWEVLAAFDRVHRWDPGVSESAWTVQRRGVGAVRRITVLGRPVEQTVTVWSDRRLLQLRASSTGPFRWLEESVRMRNEDGAPLVRFTIEADYRLPVRWLVEPRLKQRVHGAAQGLKRYLEREEMPSIIAELPSELFPLTG